MQTTVKQVYKKVSENLTFSEEIVKSIGDKVFETLLSNFKTPQSLIIKVRGLGYFYMRKNKLEDQIKNVNAILAKVSNEEHQLYETPEYFEKKTKLRDLLLERQKEYNKFLEKKNIIKKLRNDNS